MRCAGDQALPKQIRNFSNAWHYSRFGPWFSRKRYGRHIRKESRCADTPRVAVYDDGTVIFLKQSGQSATYQRKDLSAAEQADFRKRLAPTVSLKDLKRPYNLLPNVTDQPQALFNIREKEREVTTTVCGLRAAGTKLLAYTVLPGKRKPDALPDELVELHKFLCAAWVIAVARRCRR